MRRTVFFLVVTLLCALSVSAQTRPAQRGDPPVLSRIQVSSPDRFGQVSITGSSGAVFPNAYLGIRNLYTGATVFTRAGITGSFVAQIVGDAKTPYLISPADADTPRAQREQPGSMLGGPAAIWQPSPIGTDPPPTANVTNIRIDGAAEDWDGYSDAQLFATADRAVWAQRNDTSLYLLVTQAPAGVAVAEVEISIDRATYAVRFNLAETGVPTLERLNPNQTALGTVAAAAVAAQAFEARIPLFFSDRQDIVQLEAVRWLLADGATVEVPIGALIPLREAIDGLVRAQPLQEPEAAFTIGGGAGLTDEGTRAQWHANGYAGSLSAEAGDTWALQMDVVLAGLVLPDDAALLADVYFEPIALAAEADAPAEAVAGRLTNQGWTSYASALGLPIDGWGTTMPIGQWRGEASSLLRDEEGTLTFALDVGAALPADLPDGLYVPTIVGTIETASGRSRWDQAPGGFTRLPLVVSVGGVNRARLPMALFVDESSDGSRGVLPPGDGLLSNWVRFNSPTLILPPFTSTAPRRPIAYPLEPYLPTLLPNAYDQNAVPLIPLALPGGRLTGRVRTPSGAVEDLGTAPLAQNQLSTSALDEADLFGTSAPLDMLRLTTLEPRFTAYTFADYGEYTFTLNATVQDVWGNTYTGGGEYTVLAAELLDMTPGALPGTPYSIGDVVNPTLRISPAFPAEVSVTVRFLPADGGDVVVQMLTGQADRAGLFVPEQPPLIFQKPGEYTLDYEARYTALDGSLWAGSLRAAGVVAPPTGTEMRAHGGRGTSISAPFAPAWYTLERYADVAGFEADAAAMNLPYHRGDVLWINDGAAGDVSTPLYVSQSSPVTTPVDETLFSGSTARGELLIRGDVGYTYLSVTRPNATVRQVFQTGGAEPPPPWHADDPLNRQIGAGLDGMLPGDLFFNFGGAVIRPPQGSDALVAGYASAGVVLPPDDERGERVMPPGRGQDGGADGGPLLTYNGIAYDALIVPTALQPGDLLTVGDRFIFAGQLAPTLSGLVRVTYTKPSGGVATVEGEANRYGAFFEVGGLQTADEAGVWMAQVEVIIEGRTSAGVIAGAGLRGGVAGLADGRFVFAVLPAEAEALPWSGTLRDSILPIGLPYNFNFTVPQGWSNIEARFIMTTPGYVMVNEPLRVSGRSFSYQLRASELGRTISNLERDVRTPGAYVSDARQLTFIATGRDESGAPVVQARTFTLFQDRLVTLP